MSLCGITTVSLMKHRYNDVESGRTLAVREQEQLMTCAASDWYLELLLLPIRSQRSLPVSNWVWRDKENNDE